MCNVPRLAALLIAFLLLACYGCAEKTPPAPSATSSANVPPVPPPELVIEDLPEFEIPGGRLQVPEWAGTRADEPFPVREYVEELLERQSDGERWYLAGLGRLHSELADCAVSRKEELQASVERLEELLEALNPDSVTPWKVIPPDLERSAGGVAILDVVAPAIVEIDRAQRYKTCLFGTDLTLTQGKPHLRASMRFAQIMGLEIARSSQSHEFASIEQVVRRSLRLSRDVCPTSSSIGNIVGYRIERFTQASLQNHFIHHSSGWSAGEYEQIQTLLRDHNKQAASPFEHDVKESYITLGNALWGLEHKTIEPNSLNIGNPTEDLMEAVNYDAEWKELNELYSWMLLEYSAPPYHMTIPHDEFESRVRVIRENLPPRTGRPTLVNGKLANPFVYAMLMPAMSTAREACAQQECWRGISDVALQIRRFEAIQHRSPATVAELYPGGEEPDPPVDPYSGQPLKYRIIDGMAVIYSVGKDQIDQGGTEPWDAERKSGDLMHRVNLRYP